MPLTRKVLFFFLFLVAVSGVTALFAFSSASPAVRKSVDYGRIVPLLKNGDVILRKGRGIISDGLRRMARQDASFSHAGIVVKSDSGWNVVHCLGGEGAVRDGVLIDPLSDFCSNSTADSIAVVRLSDLPELQDAVAFHAAGLARKAIRFDTDFSLETENDLYCTELIYRVYLHCSRGKISLPLTRFAGMEYVACDNLYKNQFAKLIYPVLKNENQ